MVDNGITKNNWKETDISVDSLWLINERDKTGKHANVYHGNFVPQIPHQLISRYTKENDVVLELFSGSGTTLFECEELNRQYIGFDINQEIIDYVNNKMQNSQLPYKLNNCDVTNTSQFNKVIQNNLKELEKPAVDFIIAHPPYLDIVKFTSQESDLSNISDVNIFIDNIVCSFRNALQYLSKNKYLAVVMGDIYKNSEVIPLGFYVMYAIKKNFKVKLKGTIVKNIEGNRGKLGQQNIWKYRALMSDYFLFKHEYIFVFKKEF
ncbi:MAG: DNA adenine methylase [Bacteroidales bacterium]|nr:DNA adenine methylase [Bacteroidales bacterium]